MTKLDGNDRWQNKMLLTDHVDQYEEQQREMEIPVNGLLTNEERLMVRDLILLPHIDTMLAKSMAEIERSGNVLTKMYLLAGRYIQNRISKDTWELQKELKQRNVRFISEEQDDFILHYKIFFRGYQERFGLTRDVMRTEISLRLTKYTAELGRVLKDHLK
ncbi:MULTISPECIES: hypothetical protein [unclassified Paenibacillus]|uniref:hypothetical protein n=1 Tax=unclassified Paenibacillus TaxID=185978 RepID=UPI0024057244|nr:MULTISPECIES: hypothetical protein [unclassified Paenibacillus]MDF9845464.1 hypothetical protein [Paenibacillus sp. PastF-2]MDF9852048.1 hypothetical protein [Paenibacillus sp. PastM-2]MDF9858623.1 hypothetical protein [Paenibacillus sp. PastF-1]MDH6483889.1 hypothetical protein [Paenibacillus sp. PastH-2]MDH6511258.1 hypothetical protein [Paenibacillus sp. PastM-3]